MDWFCWGGCVPAPPSGSDLGEDVHARTRVPTFNEKGGG